MADCGEKIRIQYVLQEVANEEDEQKRLWVVMGEMVSEL